MPFVELFLEVVVMSKEYLADKPTLDEVNEKIGNAGGGYFLVFLP